MLFVKLVDQVIRPLNRTGNQLGIKHHIQSVYPYVFFGFLLLSVNLYNITQALEGMKRQSDRQYKFQKMDRIVPVEEIGDQREINIKKIKVFKNKKRGTG
jgi:hypothetical protein